MKLLYKLLKQDADSREGIIVTTSALGVITNAGIALIKILIGFATSSIAIASEGANNATDALSSIMTLIGAKLARKHPDAEHPFGYGRIEYLSSLVISGAILFTGIEMLLSSVRLVFDPQPIHVTFLSIVIILFAAVVKFFLGVYTIAVGKKTASGALQAVGNECRNDAFASAITIISSLIYLVLGYNLDPYAGILVSVLIIRAGAESLKDTIGDILGRPGDEELATKILREVRSTDGVMGAADMMLHNYGPDAWSGSVNVEIDHERTVGEVYQFLHELQLRIMHEYRVTMVFGIYAVDNDNPGAQELRKNIAAFCRSHEHVKSYHAVYLDAGNSRIYCDFIVDYELQDWDGLRNEFSVYMKKLYPSFSVEVTIETDFV